MRRSNARFVAVCAVFVGIKLLFQLYRGDFPGKDQALAFTWPLVCGAIALGAVGLAAERALRLPERVDARALLWAIVPGLLYGVITLIRDVAGRSPTGAGESTHLALPWSIPFYVFGAIFLEFFLRLGLLCGLAALIHVLLLKRRAFTPVFWTLDLIVALYEVLPSMISDVHRGRWEQALARLLGPLYLSNVFEGWLLLRFGWLMPVVFRLAFYLVWHILYGGLVR